MIFITILQTTNPQIRFCVQMKPAQNQLVQNVNIKSKYLNSNQQRKLIISPQTSQISISTSGDPSTYKQFHIDQLQRHQTRGNTVTLHFDNGRTYQIESKSPNHIGMALQHAKNMIMSNRFVEQNIGDKPIGVNYAQPCYTTPRLSQPATTRESSDGKVYMPSGDASRRGAVEFHASAMPIRSQQSPIYVAHQIRKSKLKQQEKKRGNSKKYKKLSCFHSPENWQMNPEQGILIVMNEEWKGNTTRIFGFVLKRFLSTGTFMGISFPVFAMKPETILQTYAKSLAPASNILTPTKDPLERMKQFTCVIWAMSLLQVTIVKPFNPVLGQTFQADINGGKYSAQQVSHHPPISAFIYQKDDYKIYGSLELSASIGINSGDGRFLGDVTIVYNDGYWCKGKLPNGKITGVLIGTTTFEPYGGSYCHDSNSCVLTFQIGDNYEFQGYLGLLTFKAKKMFEEKMKDPERFLQFQAIKKDQYCRILSTFRAKYTQWVAFDGKEYVNLNNPALMPYELVEPFDEQLPSDSRLRRDIHLLKEGKIDESQQQKERMEDQERFFRKLRQSHAPK